MASTPEGRVKKAVKKVLDAEGVYYFFPATGGYGRSGIPDIVCCVNGRFVGIECKAKGGILTALQNNERNKIIGSKGTYFFAHPNNIEVLRMLIKALKGELISL